ncbi:MAG: asparagine synthase (glutamine-hydrolyzing), partial [bacterium]|nr:asparagine synthase (glutamine-hydrolyzing) [Candidatus Kapabacteria bacterium]
MCGIAGIVGGGNRETLERMINTLQHRGPDDGGVEWFDGHGVGLAHRRLSILDLSPAGHQPMVNERGSRWITYNGEIYNFLEIRSELIAHGHRFTSNTDTEVILAAYDRWGAQCVTRFNGMFAFAIYDVETRELFMARDHLGVKPFYYVQRGSMLAFASEAKALFEIDGVERCVEHDAVLSTLMLLWVPEPKTGFKNVVKLPAGHFATFKDGVLRTTQYWDVPYGDDSAERSEGEYIEELREILERSVRRQMIADVPVGA